jgi:hypothetical protein
LTSTSIRPNRSTAASTAALAAAGSVTSRSTTSQVVVLAQRGRDVVGPACGDDHRVTGGQGRLGDVDAQTAASAGDEPNLFLAHASALLYW